MLTARELVAVVESAKPPDRAHFRGTSDHVPNLQEVTFNGYHFLLGTYNVLENSLISQVNFLRDDGSPSAWAVDRDGAQGLDRCPFAYPYRQQRRENAIVGSIVTLFKSTPCVILCLQECGIPLYARLEAESAGLFSIMKPDSQRDYKFCVTLCSVELEARRIEHSTSLLVEIGFPQRESGTQLLLPVYNVHFRYQDASVKQSLRSILCDYPLSSFFVVGDFNVPTMPQSDKAVIGGCPTRLDGLVSWLHHHVEPAREVFFAAQANGWTNWSYAKNCVDAQRTWDHVDNVMFVRGRDSKRMPGVLGLRWTVEMYK